MTLSRRVAALLSGAAFLATAGVAPVAAIPRAGGSSSGAVTITVHYKGQGAVDARHKIWIWVFDTPDIGPTATPVREESLAVSGGSIKVEGLGPDHVWIAVGYDERGDSTGNAPPASGSPIGTYSTGGGTPTAVATADRAEAVVTFDDSFRMP